MGAECSKKGKRMAVGASDEEVRERLKAHMWNAPAHSGMSEEERELQCGLADVESWEEVVGGEATDVAAEEAHEEPPQKAARPYAGRKGGKGKGKGNASVDEFAARVLTTVQAASGPTQIRRLCGSVFFVGRSATASGVHLLVAKAATEKTSAAKLSGQYLVALNETHTCFRFQTERRFHIRRSLPQTRAPNLGTDTPAFEVVASCRKSPICF